MPGGRRALAAIGAAVVLATAGIGHAQLASLHSHPPCFGAASRDPQHPCHNPALKYEVTPTPIVAADTGNWPCTRVSRSGFVTVCAFGARKAAARRTFAVIGDSHAQMWRAAVAVMANDLRWRGLTISRSSCPYSAAEKLLAPPLSSECLTWTRQVPQWFRHHPEVSVVFVAAHNGSKVVVPAGHSAFATAVAGYQRAWKRLPPSVRHVIVLRDTPSAAGDTAACVERAIADHRQAGRSCALPRRTHLPPDPAAVAQAHLHDRRVQLVDLSPFMCGRRHCYPVIGGALVVKDTSHLTRVFAQTLGPYIERRLRQLMTHW